MKKVALSKRNLRSSLIASILVCSFVLAPVSQTLHLQRAEAIPVTVVGDVTPTSWGTWLEGKITALSTAASALSTDSLVVKEYILDTIAWGLVNIILQQMIRDTTRWVNSGFQGSPAFVSNLEGFMTNIADQYAGQLIWGSGLSMLCSPFKLNIQLALDMQYRQGRGSYKAQCTLTGALNNLDNFLAGNFISGNWDDWYDVTLRPENNPYGAMLQAQAGLSLGISNGQGKNLSMLNFGGGFLTKEECTGTGGREVCKTVTPGSVIEGQLNSSLAGSQRRIEIADELNELIGALFSQLVSKALGGVRGLLGLTSSSGSSGGDYFDAMAAERTPTSYGGSESTNPEAGSLTTEQAYQGLQNNIVALITDASTYKATMYGSTCAASGNLTSSLSSQLAAASAASSASSITITTLSAYRDDYATLSNTATPAATISALLTKYGATNIPAAQNTIMTRISAVGPIHTAADNARLEMETIRNLTTEIQNFKNNIDTLCRFASSPGDTGGAL